MVDDAEDRRSQGRLPLPTVALITAGIGAFRDAPRLGAGPLVYTLAGVTAIVGVLLLIDLLASRFGDRVPARISRAVAFASLCLAPSLYVGWYLAPSTFDGMELIAAAAVMVVAAGAWLLGRSSSWFCRPNPDRTCFAMALAGTVLGSLFVLTHVEEATISLINPGSESERAMVFVGSWLACCALAPVWALKHRAAERRWWILGVAAALAVGGVAMLEFDRVVMVGHYAALHRLLEFLALGSIYGGISLGIGSAPGHRARRGIRAYVSRLSGAAVLALIAAFIVSSAVGLDPVFRSRIIRSPLGRTILDSTGTAGTIPLPPAEDHPLLHADLRHESRLKGEPPYNLVLVTVDALRGDHVGTGGHAAKVAPRMSALARESAVFQRNYSAGSRTAIGMSTIMVGRYGVNLDWKLWVGHGELMFAAAGLSQEDWDRLGPRIGYTTFPEFEKVGTLAERMSKAGLRTMATPYLAEKAKWFRRGVGFEIGFDDYNEFHQRIEAKASAEVVEMALAQIDAATDQRWFLWIHLFDPHRSHGKKRAYDRLVGETDRALGALIEGLRKRKLWDETAIVLTGDHGEAFGEHDTRYHGSTLYEEQVRVPLVVRVPGLEPRTYDFPTSTLDASATLVALAGGEMDGLEGLNLIPWLQADEAAPERPVFTELHRYKEQGRSRDMKAVVLGWLKLICDRRDGTLELFDLREDPEEEDNLLESRPEEFLELGRLLSAFWTRGERQHPLP